MSLALSGAAPNHSTPTPPGLLPPQEGRSGQLSPAHALATAGSSAVSRTREGFRTCQGTGPKARFRMSRRHHHLSPRAKPSGLSRMAHRQQAQAAGARALPSVRNLGQKQPLRGTRQMLEKTLKKLSCLSLRRGRMSVGVCVWVEGDSGFAWCGRNTWSLSKRGRGKGAEERSKSCVTGSCLSL